jgi:hypothetical protein
LAGEIMTFEGYRIFKYELPVQDKVVLNLPLHTEFMSIAEQRGKIVLYAEHYANAKERKDDGLVRFTFRIVGTGHPYNFNRALYKHVATVKLQEVALMFHIFKRSCWQSLDEPEDP